jgi:hypothetical protein
LVATAFVCACGFAAGFAAVELLDAAAVGAASVIVATDACVSASAVATPDALASGVRTSVGCLLAPCGCRAALWRRDADFFAMCFSPLSGLYWVSIERRVQATVRLVVIRINCIGLI